MIKVVFQLRPQGLFLDDFQIIENPLGEGPGDEVVWCSIIWQEGRKMFTVFTVCQWRIFSNSRRVLLKMSGYPVVLNVYDMVCNVSSFLKADTM